MPRAIVSLPCATSTPNAYTRQELSLLFESPDVQMHLEDDALLAGHRTAKGANSARKRKWFAIMGGWGHESDLIACTIGFSAS
jgi:hypothetical protein